MAKCTWSAIGAPLELFAPRGAIFVLGRLWSSGSCSSFFEVVGLGWAIRLGCIVVQESSGLYHTSPSSHLAHPHLAHSHLAYSHLAHSHLVHSHLAHSLLARSHLAHAGLARTHRGGSSGPDRSVSFGAGAFLWLLESTGLPAPVTTLTKFTLPTLTKFTHRPN